MSTFVDETFNNVENEQQGITGEGEGSSEILPNTQPLQTGGNTGAAEGSEEANGGVDGENGPILEGASGSEIEQTEKPYTIEPAQYTTKKGKVLDMFLVKPTKDEMSRERQSEARFWAKEMKGWYDRKQGGWMLRSKEDADKFVEKVFGDMQSESYDLIFFTGSPSLGKLVMEAASKHLTPVILELGGKSPCIVDRHADIKTAAKRIAWGKTLNSGQTCIAPDYLLIHEEVKEQFIEAFAKAVKELHGSDIAKSKHYVRMVNDRAFERVKGYLAEGDIRYGGRAHAEERFIEPTLLDTRISLSAPTADEKANAKGVLTEEIFGPIFPMLTFSNLDEVQGYITRREKPLAFYYFGREADGLDLIHHTSSGGACINDTIMHIANENIPFGGVGNSGMGGYHGEESFRVFSHRRSVVLTGTWIDLPFRYMPYRMFGLVKKIV